METFLNSMARLNGRTEVIKSGPLSEQNQLFQQDFETPRKIIGGQFH